MAKVSKKTPESLIKIDHLNQLFLECIDDSSGLLAPEPITHIPALDMFTTPAGLVIEVELPGVRKEDIDLTLYKNTLTVRALKFECFEEDKINYVCMERAFGRMFRSVEFPFPVDTVRINASFKNGILTITIPKVEDKRHSTRKVPIESD